MTTLISSGEERLQLDKTYQRFYIILLSIITLFFYF